MNGGATQLVFDLHRPLGLTAVRTRRDNCDIEISRPRTSVRFCSRTPSRPVSRKLGRDVAGRDRHRGRHRERGVIRAHADHRVGGAQLVHRDRDGCLTGGGDLIWAWRNDDRDVVAVMPTLGGVPVRWMEGDRRTDDEQSERKGEQTIVGYHTAIVLSIGLM